MSDDPFTDGLVAVIGLACRFPGAPNSRALWQLLVAGQDAMSKVPRERWRAADYVDPDRRAPGKMVTAVGGFLPAVDGFDPEFFGISPREAVQIDPQQRLALELCWEALEHAGVAPHGLRDSDAGVFMGAMWNDYEKLHGIEDIEQHSGTGWHLGVVPGRVSHALHLRGPSMAIDTACSSSLVAVHLACKALLDRETSLALAGGVSLMLTPHVGVAMSKFGGTSVSGRCFAYDARANGYVRGEGGGVVALRRYQDAVANGDPILAVIRASAVNNDGYSEGLTVPSETAQRSLLRDVYARAGVDPRTVSFVEGHGTGTAIGDPIEARAIGLELGRGRRDPLWLGSIKPNIGHTEAASGVASLIKVVLSLQAGVIPPNLNFEQPNPAIDFDGLQLRVPTRPQPWPGVPVAGVNSFGFGGTNCHLVVAGVESGGHPQHPASSLPGLNQPTKVSASGREALARAASPGRHHLIAVSARSAAALDARLEQLRDCVQAGGVALEDLAHTLWHRRTHLEHRAVVVAGTLAQLAERLQAPQRAPLGAAQARPQLAFVFSGQGSQWVGMGRELVRLQPVFRAALAECSALMQPLLGWSLIDLVEREGDPDPLEVHLRHVDGIQPAIYAMQVALAQTWRALGVIPNAVAGHSMGEVAAAVAAGAISVHDGARITCSRAALLRRISGQGGMVSVALDVAATERALATSPDRYAGLGVAVDAGAGSTVVSGGLDALARLQADLEAQGIECRSVAVDVAAHSPQIDALADELLAAIQDIRPRASSVRMISSVTGAEVDYRELQPAYWVRNLRDPVRFADAAQQLFATGHSVFVEVSPHPLLTWPLRQIAKARGQQACTAVGSMRRARPDHEVLLEAVGVLHNHGFAVALEQPGVLAELPAYPWQRRRFWPRARPLQRQPSPRDAEPDLVASFEPARVDVLGAHAVGGRPIVAAGVVLELVLRAWAMLEAGAGAAVKIEQLEFAAPVPGDQRVRLELRGPGFSLGPSDAAASVFGRVAGCSPDLSQDTPPAPAPYTKHDAEQHYRALAERGVAYLPSLRAVASAQVGPLSARVRVAPGQARAALLDAAFQAVLAAVGEDGSFVTAALAVAQLDPTKLATTAEIHAEVSQVGRGAGELEGRAWLLDPHGAVVAALSGIRLARVRRDESSVLRRRRWRPLGPVAVAPRGVAPREGAGPTWLVVCPDQRPRAAVLEALATHGVPARGAAAHTLDSIGRVAHGAEAEPPEDVRGILVVFGADGAQPDGPHAATVTACEKVIAAARACVELQRTRGDAVQLVIVTERAHATADTEGVTIGGSALLGLARVAVTEHPGLRLRTIDLGDLDDPVQRAGLAAELHNQPEASPASVSLRAGPDGLARLVPTLEPEPVTHLDWEPRAGTVIVTGGLGGIGRAVVAWLVERGVDRVVILGRRSLDPAAAAFVDGLAASGRSQLHYLAVDIADHAALRDALAPELVHVIGVIHSAAVLTDAPLLEHTAAQLQAALRPKLLGAWNLHELTRGRELEFFVLFGSLGGWIGLPGQASYAAANAALDGLAEHRWARGLPAVSVGWCGWEGLGFARSAGGAASLDRLAADGIGSLAPAQALELLGHLLTGEGAPVIAVMPPAARAEVASIDSAAQLAELAKLVPARRRVVVGERVLTEVAAVLREEPARVDLARPLKDLGLDSLMSVELAERLARALGIQTEPTLIWRHPSVDALVAFFMGQLVPDQADVVEVSGTDDALDALVAQLDELSDEDAQAMAQAIARTPTGTDA
ncbi:type I polyketide synthase [Enhygromyxa salina]|nr:type I polyketide synthase [Enhygromyxa salina]